MNTPIVSVCVITYNSQQTVLETLESIYKQSYAFIQLIISDDSSNDNTVKICSDWLDCHKERFVSTHLLVSSINQGITANCNRAIEKSIGKWVKIIAGDDILLDNFMDVSLTYAEKYSPTVVLSNVEPFGELSDIKLKYHFKSGYFFCTNKQILYKLLQCNFISAPSALISRNFLLENGLFDKRVPNIEDWPLWIKVFRYREPIIFINKTLVKYRISNSSISLSAHNQIKFLESMRLMSEILIEESKSQDLLMWFYIRSKYIAKNIFLYYLSCFLRIINPVTYYLYYIDMLAKYYSTKFKDNDKNNVVFINF